ncbi:MAG: hypothetical protein GX902_04530, partial [Lentisphaerae bacterium]|nr:hypothetical protein [Lentisphaerota bacterium]
MHIFLFRIINLLDQHPATFLNQLGCGGGDDSGYPAIAEERGAAVCVADQPWTVSGKFGIEDFLQCEHGFPSVGKDGGWFRAADGSEFLFSQLTVKVEMVNFSGMPSPAAGALEGISPPIGCHERPRHML